MRILIVEDQKEILTFLKTNFERKCFAVDGAEDGKQGAQKAKVNDYDCILLDNHLPHKTGREICEELRSLKKNVPIIMLSVETNASKKAEVINLGADDFVSKPFCFEELLARVNAVLRRPSRIAENILTISDLSLNILKHEVKRGKKEIKLTKKEFMILEFLMKNQENPMPRHAILEHAWDINGDIFSNTIESHMVSLRKKIDANFSQKLIHTISGYGYKISLK